MLACHTARHEHRTSESEPGAMLSAVSLSLRECVVVEKQMNPRALGRCSVKTALAVVSKNSAQRLTHGNSICVMNEGTNELIHGSSLVTPTQLEPTFRDDLSVN